MTLLLRKIPDGGKRKPTEKEQAQMLRETADFQRRFLDGGLVPDIALEILQKYGEGYVLQKMMEEAGILPAAIPEPVRCNPIKHRDIAFMKEFPVQAPPQFYPG